MLRFRRYFNITTRTCTTKVVSKRVNNYTKTINLPKTEFPSRLKEAARSDVVKRLNETTFANLYNWQKENLRGKEYVLHDGPPYANGDLHMGHAINKISKDIVLRHNIVSRNKVHYRPGWDCHGLPIELKAKGIKTDMPPIDVRQKAREFALETLDKQRDEFQSWGITSNWNQNNGIYRTLDIDYIQNQLNIFYNLYQKKLIYRELKPVYFSPSSGTVLAEAELEYKVLTSPSLTFRVKLAKLPNNVTIPLNASLYALIWTTTPWTLPMNQAVCFNPKLTYNLIQLENSDDCYIIAKSLLGDLQKSLDQDSVKVITEFSGTELDGCSYLSPVDKIELPFWSADHVLDDKGTGLVHTAPAHGADDYLISLKKKIPLKCFIDDKGYYNHLAPDFLRNKSVQKDGNDLVVEHIQTDIVHLGSISHSCPIDWRTKKPVIMSASHQWFINTERIKSTAIEQIKEVEFYPTSANDNKRTKLINMLDTRPYWCISRQRAWGCPIPVFYSKLNGEPIVDKEIIDGICAQTEKHGNIDFWWAKDISELIPSDILKKLNLKENDVAKGKDILDIWFDSGISWSYALESSKIADLYLEGQDQFTGWFQSSLMTSVACRGIAPFKSIYVHGFAVDKDGIKMSKSKGNVTKPSDIVNKYGIDALRWWVATSNKDDKVPVKINSLQLSAEVVAKFRNSLKYLVGSISKKSLADIDIDRLNVLDKYFLNSLIELDDKIVGLYKNYDISASTKVLVNFITNDFSAQYLNYTKDRLYCSQSEDSASTRDVLLATYCIVSKHLWPIIPFLIEECWSYYDNEPFYKTAVIPPNCWRNSDYNDTIRAAENLRHEILQKHPVFKMWKFNIDVQVNASVLNSLKKIHTVDGEFHNNSDLCEILQAQSVRISLSVSNDTKIEISDVTSDLCPRCRRFQVTTSVDVCSRCEQVLTNLSR